jgi:uncharacterized membrane protein
MGEAMDGKILDAVVTEYWTRSMTKAVTYRIAILTLDFLIIYWFTGRYEIAFGFMLLSNIYTSVAYYLHERIWARIRWGISDV